MYGHGQDPAPSGGQQSAFSHPPHLASYSSAGPSSAGGKQPGGSPGRFSPGQYGVGYPASHLGVIPSSHHGAFHAGMRGDASNVGPSPGFSSPWSPHYGGGGSMPGNGVGGPTGSPLVRSTSRAASMEDDGDQGNSDDDDDDEDDSEDSEDDEDDDDDGNAAPKKRKRGGNSSNGRKSDAKGGPSSSKSATGTAGSNGGSGGGGKKPKPTRGAKACTHCRRLKMRCVGAEEGPPCARCRQTGHDCIFEESNRGKKGGKSSQQRNEAMWQSLRKMEATLNTVLAGLRAQGATAAAAAVGPGVPPLAAPPPALPTSAPSFARHAAPSSSGPSSSASGPSHRARFVEPERPSAPSMPRSHSFGERQARASSPRLHQLPDNTLNPLGLLAEASLHNHSRLKRTGSNRSAAPGAANSVAGSTHSRTERSASGSAAGMSPGTNVPVATKVEEGDTSASGTAPVSTPSVEVDLEKDPAAAAEARALDSLVHKSRSRSSVSGTGDGGAPSGNGTVSAAAKEQEEKEADEAVAATVAAETAGSSSQNWPKMSDADKPQLGVASDAYFRPGPMTILPLRRIIIERELPPELLTEGVVSSKEVLELFRIFFHYCAQHVILLDPDWHTPTMICSRSPFLFTCILAVASKFYLKRPDLYAKCLAKARKSAFVILSRGFKSVEICQGLLLLTLWNQPAERYETDRTWLFSGIAIRMATDLNLHRKTVPPPGTSDEAMREILNRERTWLYCFSVDRSLSNQMGKPWTIREDWIIRNSRDWGNQKLSQPSDRALTAIVELLRLTSRQLDFLYSSTASASGLNTDIDYSTIIGVYNQQLDRWAEEWSSLGPPGEPYDPEKDDEDHTKRTLHFLSGARPIRFYYASLILNSFGLQHSVDFPVQSGLDKAFYYAKCFEAAKNIILASRERMAPVLGYAPDTIYVILSYACAFLLKLARPAFADYADEDTIVNLVTEGVNLLERVAMHPTHTPALYASFLRALLHARTELASRSGYTTPYRSRAASPSGLDENGEKIGDEQGASAAADGEGQANGNGGGATNGAASEAHSRRASTVAEMAHALPGGFSGLASTLPGGSAGAGLGGAFGNMPGEQAAANNTLDPSLAAGNNAGAHGGMQDFLQNNWWSSLLPPGFGGPLEGALSGLPGTFSPISGSTGVAPSAGILHSAGGLGAGMTPGQTRANSPTASIIPHFGTNLTFDFSTPGGPGAAP